MRPFSISESEGSAFSGAGSALESITDGILVVDPAGKIVFYNQNFARMWSIPQEILDSGEDERALDYAVGQLKNPDQFRARVRELYGSPEEESFDTIEFLDGKIFERYSVPHRLDGKTAGRVWSFRDVSERKGAEKETEHLLSLLYAILDSTVDGILAQDAEGKATHYNYRFVKMWNIPREMADRGDVAEMLAYVAPQLEDPLGFMESAKKSKSFSATECFDILIFKDGRVFERYVKPHFVGKEVKGWVASFKDATSRVKTEKELENQRHLLEQKVERLRRSNEDLEQFASIASHDLKEPIRLISNYLDLAEKRYGGQLGGECKELLGIVKDQAGRMHRFVDDLLYYATCNNHPGESAQVRPEASLAEACDNLKAEIAKTGARVVSTFLPEVMAGHAALTEIFQNLISNSLKFRSEAIPEIRISAQAGSGMCVFSVSDNGIGIDPQYAQTAFMLFGRLHSADQYPGTGIGLAVCKKLVENFGGKLWLKSDSGKGATFQFTLPLASN